MVEEGSAEMEGVGEEVEEGVEDSAVAEEVEGAVEEEVGEAVAVVEVGEVREE